MIGRVLQGRYQVVQSLGAGVFGQTYIAVDINHPENPKCVVKQLKVTSSQPSHLETLRLRFLTETETLKRLGHHNQIPQLISCFEEEKRFYLVQDFVEGHSLTRELPLNQGLSDCWSESEVVQFLIDALSILEFIHSQGVIHCDIKPENLIRRAADNKLVMIDFGSIQPVDFDSSTALPIYRIPVTSLGYIPPEQFIGQTQPSSDIYALGIIAIQALTGLMPLQFKIDQQSNEILWRYGSTRSTGSRYTRTSSPRNEFRGDMVPVGDYLAAVISRIIRYNHKERFQSASEVIQVLKQIPLDFQQPDVLDARYSIINSVGSPRQSRSLAKPKQSTLLTGVRIGLAANSLVLGFGVYSLVSNSPAYSETETLYRATEEYQSGDLEGAIALAKSIPNNSNVYPEAQATIEEWQKQWQLASENYRKAETAAQEERWSDVLKIAPRIPDILYWQSKTDKLVARAQANTDIENNGLLAKAYDKATNRDFDTAINYLEQIPQKSLKGDVAREKLLEYREKRQVRAAYLLQKAYNKAEGRNFDDAMKYLEQIPQETTVYAIAQAKLIEYNQKQRIAGKDGKIPPLSIAKATAQDKNADKSFIDSSSSTKLSDFHLDHELLGEVNIR
jgi:serine/threonine protein kinase